MANKKFCLGMLAMALVFGMTVIGCDIDGPTDGGAKTLEFKVETWSLSWATISKIEFINGSNSSDPVLAAETVQIAPGEMSNIYRVSGFTKKEGDAHIFGVKFTFESGSSAFKWSTTSKSKVKIHTFTTAGTVMEFSEENW
jgi:hypothetical protein